ncbi:MAG TPA: ABC transporter substrate-binding protein [Candidatus Binatia bacterium]|jgi:NitT/TauT family transport system substrate-binding protein
MRGIKHIAGLICSSILLFSWFPAEAQEKTRIAWAALNPAASPMWVVQEKGLLRKQGVDAEIIGINSSPIAMQALLAGDLDVIVTSVTTLVGTRLAGADTIMIQTLVPTFVDHIVSASSITELQHLKGKTGGVNRVGSTSDLGLRLALRRLGINPDSEMKIITAGGNPERLAALSRGLIQFTIMPEPWVREAEKLGFRDLLDTGSLALPFHWNAVLTRESTIKSKRGLIAKVVRANADAIHFIKTDKEGTKAIFSKFLKLNDPEGLERAARAYAAIFPINTMPTPEGVKTLLDDMAPRDPRAKAADPRRYVDMTFVQELELSGYLKQLYKR